MRSRAGITLVEILVGVVIGALAIALALKLFAGGQSNVVASRSRFDQTSSLATLSGDLQKNMASGDVRFFAFSGNGATGDNPLARFLVPQAGACVTSLSAPAANCAPNDAFVYLHYNKTTTPAVTVICALDAASSIYLVDMSNLTYGQSQLLPDGFQVQLTPGSPTTLPTGKVNVGANALIALMDPPTATLWVSTLAPAAYGVTQDPNTGALNPPLPTACQGLLQVTSPPGASPTLYNLSGLATVTLQPFIMNDFTSGSVVSSAEKAAALGKFPMRLFDATVRAVGYLPPVANATSGSFVMRQCALGAQGAVICAPTDVINVPSVTGVTIDAFFSLQLGNQTASRYELLSPLMTLAQSCAAPDCLPLNVPTNSQMKVFWDGTETTAALSSAGFSLVKMESLSRLRFHILSSVGRQENDFDVIFP